MVYGLSLFHPDDIHPEFGSGIRVLKLGDAHTETFLSIVGDEGSSALPKHERKTLTTHLNLACYFGYASWGVEALRSISGQNRGTAIDLTLLLLKHAQDLFFAERVGPLREHLWKQPHPMYFYCIPATSAETHLRTGELFRSVGPPVLCVLPKSPAVARHYGKTETEIRLIAGQVMWLIRKLCACHHIREAKQLIEAVEGWGKYIAPLTLIMEQERIEKNNPYLITPESRQALLSEIRVTSVASFRTCS